MSKNQQYAEQYAEFAMEQMRRYGIPASVTLAQGILKAPTDKAVWRRTKTTISVSRLRLRGLPREAGTEYMTMISLTRSFAAMTA